MASKQAASQLCQENVAVMKECNITKPSISRHMADMLDSYGRSSRKQFKRNKEIKVKRLQCICKNTCEDKKRNILYGYIMLRDLVFGVFSGIHNVHGKTYGTKIHGSNNI